MKLKTVMNVGWVLKTMGILDPAIKLRFLIVKKLKKFRTYEHNRSEKIADLLKKRSLNQVMKLKTRD